MLKQSRNSAKFILAVAASGAGCDTTTTTPSREPGKTDAAVGVATPAGGDASGDASAHEGASNDTSTHHAGSSGIDVDSETRRIGESQRVTETRDTLQTLVGTAAGSSESATSTTDGAGSGDCVFAVITNQVSPKMPTVGVVEWSLTGEAPSRATIKFELVGATETQLNVGGEAPVGLTKPNYRTLLLGLKQNSDYRFRIEAVQGERTCVSDEFALPTTGVLQGAPTERAVTVEQPEARTPGFILTPGGYGGYGAYILDADAAVVWYVNGPPDPGRMHMDYEGENMWVMSLNPLVGVSGQLQFVSMDGLTTGDVVEGFELAHHDFVVMPGGKLATMVFRVNFEDFVSFEPYFTQPESDLVVRAPDGTITTAFKVGSNLYKSANYYHANALHYIPEDDSFTISDLNPDLVVKVSSTGQVQWQLGGSCVDAPAGAAKCVEGTWIDNHGHHLLSDGTFLLFNNHITEEIEREDVKHSRILEFEITATADSMTAVPIKEYTGAYLSGILGDVQRLPNGNTLITYSAEGKIVEVDADWNVVQTITGNFGYAEWRPTLYGPPVRL